VAVSLVVVGGSWGGAQAARMLLSRLPGTFAAPVVIVLHRAPDTDDGMLSRTLAQGCALAVADAEDKQPLQAGCVLIAPAGYHLLMEIGNIALSTEEAVHFSRPSIDVAFESASRSYGDGVAAVVLSGANADGAAGCARIAATGGTVLIQDPASAARREMPCAALAACPQPELTGDPAALGDRLLELAA